MPDTTDRVTVYSDYVCPFCYLGRRSLQRYEADRNDPLRIDWHPFDLRTQKRGPDGNLDHDVDDGKNDAYYDRARENVRRLAERYDVDMTLETASDIDSLPAQLVSFHVGETHPDRWRSFDEAVFEALWVDGRDIGDGDVLASLAANVGLDTGVVGEALDDDDLRKRLFERFRAARRHGVTGVPTFVAGGRAARGAVPPDQLRQLVEEP